MSALLGLATETEGCRASQTRLREGGRYLSTPQNRSFVIAAERAALHHEADVLRAQPAADHDQPKPSPFAVPHLRGALQCAPDLPALRRPLHHGLARVRRDPDLAWAFLRHTGLHL